jgi:hypothetical protein
MMVIAGPEIEEKNNSEQSRKLEPQVANEYTECQISWQSCSDGYILFIIPAPSHLESCRVGATASCREPNRKGKAEKDHANAFKNHQ